MHASRVPRLLVVDDEPICRRAVVDLAQACGLQCDSAADGLSGLALARAERYDLLVLDWRMPGMTGSEMMLALRSDPAAASARSRMVLVTGELVDVELERNRGFDAVLAKPLSPEQLQQLLGLSLAVATVPGPDPGLLDDLLALSALGGSRELLGNLRQMLLTELHADLVRMPAQLAEGAVLLLRERLHQLTGGARYCGATRLAEAADQLRQTVKSGLPADEAWSRFETVCRLTIEALENS